MKMTDFVKRTSNRDRKLQSRLNECATNIATYAQKNKKRNKLAEAQLKMKFIILNVIS